MEEELPMSLEYFTDAATFTQQAQPFLLEHEAENSLLLGLLDRIANNALRFPITPMLALLREGESVVAAVVRTPPHNIVLPVMDLAAVDSLARALFADGIILPGAIGPHQVADTFAATWCALSGQLPEIHLRERVYELDAVIAPGPTSGHFRWATPADRETLIAWRVAFDREALGVAEPDRAYLETWVDQIISRAAYRGLGVWEDEGRMVCYAGFGGRTPHGMRVAPVYTPPELRGHGYASACTAALSQFLLDSGHQYCYLNTDLANPTSNKIYQAIGYRPVGDVLELRFIYV
jgi:uncharacterized protein